MSVESIVFLYFTLALVNILLNILLNPASQNEIVAGQTSTVNILNISLAQWNSIEGWFTL